MEGALPLRTTRYLCAFIYIMAPYSARPGLRTTRTCTPLGAKTPQEPRPRPPQIFASRPASSFDGRCGYVENNVCQQRRIRTPSCKDSRCVLRVANASCTHVERATCAAHPTSSIDNPLEKHVASMQGGSGRSTRDMGAVYDMKRTKHIRSKRRSWQSMRFFWAYWNGVQNQPICYKIACYARGTVRHLKFALRPSVAFTSRCGACRRLQCNDAKRAYAHWLVRRPAKHPAHRRRK